jgi:hypothetical protein
MSRYPTLIETELGIQSKTGSGQGEMIDRFTLSRIFQGDIFSNVFPLLQTVK